MVCYSHIPASLGLGKLTGVAIVLALMKPRKKAAVHGKQGREAYGLSIAESDLG